ncbi:MAG TPA: alpha/beta hydrolase [Paenirhodobacter sp.]
MTAQTHIAADGTRLRWTGQTDHPAVLFQHGLGGDDGQTAGVFPTDTTAGRVTMECRGHGQSDYGDAPFGFGLFGTDLHGFRQARTAGPVFLGGISMGAALALQEAKQAPDDVLGLIVVRPAWGAGRVRPNMDPVHQVAQDILEGGTLAAFDASDIARDLARHSPDNLASLRGYHTRPDAQRFAAVVAAMSADDPGISLGDLAAMTMPTLILGAPRDIIHPQALAQELARDLPNVEYHTLPDKADDPAGHRQAAARFISDFLHRFSKG